MPLCVFVSEGCICIVCHVYVSVLCLCVWTCSMYRRGMGIEYDYLFIRVVIFKSFQVGRWESESRNKSLEQNKKILTLKLQK